MLTLAFAAAVAFSVVLGESRDQKFTGWAAFWVGWLVMSLGCVPLATLFNVVGLFFATRVWGMPPRTRLAVIEVLAAVLHPLGWYLFSDPSRPSGTGYPPLFELWIVAGSLPVAILFVGALGRSPDGRPASRAA